jgi:hypothetical protein
MSRRLAALACLLWASPWTLFGMAVGALGLLTGGRVRREGRVLEFYGGFVATYLRVFPLIRGAAAVTLGHTVLARDAATARRTRAHERVHVRQYERWGPLFVPLYLLHWCRLRLTGHNPYLDNPFEQEAFAETDSDSDSDSDQS